MSEFCKKCHQLKRTPTSLCACNYSPKKKTEEKGIKQVSDKKKEKIKTRGSLPEFYRKISNKHFNEFGDGECQICKGPFNIGEVLNQRTCFAHILAKGEGKYEAYAMFPNNIAVVCSDTCHNKLDSMTSGIRNFLEEEIKNLREIDLDNLGKYINN